MMSFFHSTKTANPRLYTILDTLYFHRQSRMVYNSKFGKILAGVSREREREEERENKENKNLIYINAIRILRRR